jgi:hypothetical protein
MLAGNTSIIKAATEATGPQQVSPLGRLLARLTSPGLLHDAGIEMNAYSRIIHAGSNKEASDCV